MPDQLLPKRAQRISADDERDSPLMAGMKGFAQGAGESAYNMLVPQSPEELALELIPGGKLAATALGAAAPLMRKMPFGAKPERMDKIVKAAEQLPNEFNRTAPTPNRISEVAAYLEAEDARNALYNAQLRDKTMIRGGQFSENMIEHFPHLKDNLEGVTGWNDGALSAELKQGNPVVVSRGDITGVAIPENIKPPSYRSMNRPEIYDPKTGQRLPIEQEFKATARRGEQKAAIQGRETMDPATVKFRQEQRERMRQRMSPESTMQDIIPEYSVSGSAFGPSKHSLNLDASVPAMKVVDDAPYGINASTASPGGGSLEEVRRTADMNRRGETFQTRFKGTTAPSTVDRKGKLRPGEEYGIMTPTGFRVLDRGE